MPRTLPDSLTFRYAQTNVVLTPGDDGAYEGECPICLATLSLIPSVIRVHRDETFSTTRVIECVGCEVPFKVTRSEVPDEEPADEDDGHNPWLD